MRFKCRGWEGIKEFMKVEQGVGVIELVLILVGIFWGMLR